MLIEGLTEIISQDLHVKNSVKSDRIHALDSDVINRIAAGEVVQRPSSALKELMENALDAGASQITIILKSGGMKMLSVQDNGRGIHKEDLPLLCKRFTTSKISSYEDLRKIQTFGFRGEALCSISLVSRLSVLTKRKSSNDECAFKAQYLNEEMISCQPVAGLDGTLITVEDMFYNTPLRLASLKNHNEEHQNCIKVVSKYAIHNAGRAAFVLKKHGQTRADVHTSIKSQIFGGSNADAIRKNEILAQKDAIRTIFGNAVTQELIEVDWKGPDAFGNPVIQGFVSTTNYHSKSSGQFILFINHRLVKCDSLKKSIETFYQEILPKNCSPFVYLSLQVKSESVDVNVHPTKSKVHFLYEKEISDLLRAHLQEALKVSNVSRAFYTQIQAPISNGSDFSCITNTTKEGVLTSKANTNAFVSTSKEGAPASKARVQNKNESDSKSIKISASESKKSAGIEDVVRSHPERKTNPQNLVRTKSSQHNGALYAYLQHPERNIFMASSQKSKPKPFKIPESIEFLTREIEKSSSDNLEKIFENLVYVGCVDYDSVLIQCTTKLYLLKFQYCSFCFFYERVIRNFGNDEVIELVPPLSIEKLAYLALDSPESNWTPEDGDKDSIVNYLVDFLKSRSDILSKGFGVRISESGNIESLPLLLKGYEPALLRLPFFLLRLGTEVDWGAECECFNGIAKELALLYQVWDNSLYQSGITNKTLPDVSWMIQHVLLPSMKSGFSAPSQLSSNGAVIQIAALEKLYKIFERC